MKIIDTVELFIPGDWGEENFTADSPCKVSCIRGADIVPIENNNFESIPTRYISKRSYSTKCLQVGDIVVEKSGGSPTQSTGRVSFVSKELIDTCGSVVCSNFCVAFRVKKKWNPLYIYYYIQHIYNSGAFFNFEGKTSGIKNLQLEAAYNAIPIEDIDKTVQDSVVSVLDKIQKKIMINRQINQNLEALAKQLYDYWFVQFDFPNEEGKPYKSSDGAMVKDSRTNRLLPENWNVKTISEIEGDIITGKTPSTSDEANFGGDIPFITIDDIRKAPFIYVTERTLTEKGANSQSNKFLPEGSLCCSCIGTTGIIGFVGKRGQTNQQINTIVFEDDINKEFLYFSLNLYFQFAKAKTGNILPNMNKEEFSNILVVYPSKDILQRFHTIASTLFSQINNNVIELNTLTKQRDELLPLLMNGQVLLNSDLSHD